jgi:hypothetical protein
MRIRIANFSLLGNDFAPSDERFPTFRSNMAPSSSGGKNLVLGPYVQEEVAVNAFICQAVLRQVHSRCQSEFSTQCDLVLPLSISSILSFPLCYPVSAYIFFPVLPPLYLSFNNVLYKAVPTQDVTNPVNLPSFTVCEIIPVLLAVTLSFPLPFLQ